MSSFNKIETDLSLGHLFWIQTSLTLRTFMNKEKRQQTTQRYLTEDQINKQVQQR